MKFILFGISLLLFIGCSSNNAELSKPTQSKKNNLATITSEKYKIFSIDNRVKLEKGGNNRIFSISEGLHKIEAKMSHYKCVSVGSLFLGDRRRICSSETTPLFGIKFKANKGKRYKLISKPGSTPKTDNPLIVNMLTGEIVSF